MSAVRRKGLQGQRQHDLEDKTQGAHQSSYTGLSWEQGAGGLPGLREDSPHMALPPATPLVYDTRHG